MRQQAYVEQQGVSYATMLHWCRQYRAKHNTSQGHELGRHREFVSLRTEISSQDTREASLVVMFVLADNASKTWRRIDGFNHIANVLNGLPFVDGELKMAA
jgi:hypothetical protein